MSAKPNNTVKTAPRVLLAVASALLGAGAIVHAMAFNSAVRAVAASNLPLFYGNSLKVFWVADSTTLSFLAGAFALLAVRPLCGSRLVLWLLAGIPAALATLLYVFMGPFFGGHILATVTVAVVLAGCSYTRGPLHLELIAKLDTSGGQH